MPKCHKAMQNGFTELEALRSFVEQQYAHLPKDDRPTFRQTGAALTYCKNLAVELLKKTGGGQTFVTTDSDETAEIEDVQVVEGNRVAAISDSDVVQLLEEALSYLRLRQRHNPAAFLVEEGIRWTKMPIGDWYLEVSQDTNLSDFISKLMRRRGSQTS